MMQAPQILWRHGRYAVGFLRNDLSSLRRQNHSSNSPTSRAIAAQRRARLSGFSWAVTIAISDDAGNLLWLQRALDSAAAHKCIAPAKAAAMGRESKVYEDIINGGRTAFLTAPRCRACSEGGVPIRKVDRDRRDRRERREKSNEDAQIAKAGNCRPRPLRVSRAQSKTPISTSAFLFTIG